MQPSVIYTLLLLTSLRAKLAECCETRSECPLLMECCEGVCERVCSMACSNDTDCQKINSELTCVQNICTRISAERSDGDMTAVNDTSNAEDAKEKILRACAGENNNECSYGKICRGGMCIEPSGQPTSTSDNLMSIGHNNEKKASPTTTSPTSATRPFLNGNQEFVIALVGFSILFMNFCLISFYLARKRRRRTLQQRSEGTQSSLTADDFNANINGAQDSEQPISDHYNRMGMDNFALNGELDGFTSDFVLPQVRLPPYDFNSAYHKPRPIGAEESEELEGETVDVHDDSEDPPPYCNQSFENSGRPPSYDDILKLPTES